MNLYEIADVSFDAACQERYDVGFFASGYEERCAHIAQRLDPAQIGRTVVLGFEEHSEDKTRKASNKMFVDRWHTPPWTAKADDDSFVFEILRSLSLSEGSHVRIVVDYSSMSRLWYSAILNWAKLVARGRRITIDFLYSVGQHQRNISPMVIRDILAIPGLEGRVSRRGQSVAVFGLGFDGLASLCVLDRLEPDVVYSFYADPAAFADYPRRVRESNGEMVKHYSKHVLRAPLSSIEQTYRRITELVIRHTGESAVNLVPMGPKPHVLAAILVALRLDEITCLRVSGGRDRTEGVQATGEIVCTRVEFRSARGPGVSPEPATVPG
ncbi:MAG: hypothetical protein ABSD96_23005 [Candidatus Korobacteraceae bacterium]|jgi:hypothetical protein